jgi:hypothetical protein
VKFRAGRQPDFNSSVASVDLQYTLRTRTQFSVTAQRDLEYSYLDAQIDYVLAGFTTAVTHRFGDRWDAGARVGRYNLGYRRHAVTPIAVPSPAPVLTPDSAPDVLLDPVPDPVAPPREYPDEAILRAGMSLGFTMGRSRIGFDVDHQSRESEGLFGRSYSRLRIGSSLTYAF